MALRKIEQEIVWITLGQALAASGSFIGVLLLTRHLPPAVYGEVALGMTLVTLVQLLAFGPIGASLVRYFAYAQEKQQIPSFLQATLQLIFYITLLLIVIGSISMGILIFTRNTMALGIGTSAALLAILLGYAAAFDNMQNAARHRAVVAWHQGLGEWLRYLVAILFIKLFGVSGGLVLLGYSAAAAIKLCSQFFFFNRQFSLVGQSSSQEISKWGQQLVTYAWPFVIWGIFYWMSTASERWSLQILATNHEVGLYTVLYQLGYYPILLLSTSSTQLFTPILFKQAGIDPNSTRMSQAYRWNNRLLVGTLIIVFVGTLIAFLTHTWLFEILVASEYRSVSYLLPWVLLAGGLFAAGQVSAMKMLIQTDSQALLTPKIATSMITIILNFLGVYLGGLAGLVYALVISSVLYFLWMVWKTSG